MRINGARKTHTAHSIGNCSFHSTRFLFLILTLYSGSSLVCMHLYYVNPSLSSIKRKLTKKETFP
jgi:hypothetical protein